MAKQTAQSGIMAHLGTKYIQGYEKHRNDETTYSSYGDLPGGVSGVAKLVDLRFDKVKPDEKGGKEKKYLGEYYFFARAIVVEPDVFIDERGNRVRTAGKGTSLFEMVCDTPDDKNRKTVADHMAQVTLYLRRLGLDTKKIPPDQLEAHMKALVDTTRPGFKPTYVYFTTTQSEPTEQYPNPKVWHNWEGKAYDYVPPSKAQTAASGVNQGSAIPAYQAGKSAGTNGATSGSGDDYVLHDLAERADSGDAKAAKELKSIAIKEGVEQSTLNDPDVAWSEIADTILEIREGKTKDVEPDTDDDDDREEAPKAPPPQSLRRKQRRNRK